MVRVFNETMKGSLEDKFKRDKEYRDYREITIYGEYLGPQSFAGRHVTGDSMRIVLFDVFTRT